MNDWLALHLAMVSGIQGREPALQRASLSQENQCNIMVPGLTEDDVRSDLQKHTANIMFRGRHLNKRWRNKSFMRIEFYREL